MPAKVELTLLRDLRSVRIVLHIEVPFSGLAILTWVAVRKMIPDWVPVTPNISETRRVTIMLTTYHMTTRAEAAGNQSSLAAESLPADQSVSKRGPRMYCNWEPKELPVSF